MFSEFLVPMMMIWFQRIGYDFQTIRIYCIIQCRLMLVHMKRNRLITETVGESSYLALFCFRVWRKSSPYDDLWFDIIVIDNCSLYKLCFISAIYFCWNNFDCLFLIWLTLRPNTPLYINNRVLFIVILFDFAEVSQSKWVEVYFRIKWNLIYGNCS